MPQQDHDGHSRTRSVTETTVRHGKGGGDAQWHGKGGGDAQWHGKGKGGRARAAPLAIGDAQNEAACPLSLCISLQHFPQLRSFASFQETHNIQAMFSQVIGIPGHLIDQIDVASFLAVGRGGKGAGRDVATISEFLLLHCWDQEIRTHPFQINPNRHISFRHDHPSTPTSFQHPLHGSTLWHSNSIQFAMLASFCFARVWPHALKKIIKFFRSSSSARTAKSRNVRSCEFRFVTS